MVNREAGIEQRGQLAGHDRELAAAHPPAAQHGLAEPLPQGRQAAAGADLLRGERQVPLAAQLLDDRSLAVRLEFPLDDFAGPGHRPKMKARHQSTSRVTRNTSSIVVTPVEALAMPS